MKKFLVFLLSIFLLSSCVAEKGLTRRGYVRTVRSQAFKANGNKNVPAQMSQLKYNQMTRAQIVKMSEAADTVKLFPCLLINDKIGYNEKTTFYFTNNFAKDIPKTFTLDPASEDTIFLPAGEYVVEVVCGSFSRKSISHVDPRITHGIKTNGKRRNFYLISQKLMND